MTANKLTLHIRFMNRRDMDEVLAIERDVFEFPWLYEDFEKCLSQRTCVGMVVEHREKVVGFFIYELRPKKLRIMNIAVRRDKWRQGVGRAIIEKLISQIRGSRRISLTLQIRDRNLPAQQFFRAMGFKATGILRDFYEDTDEDAYEFQLMVR